MIGLSPWPLPSCGPVGFMRLLVSKNKKAEMKHTLEVLSFPGML